MRHIAVLMTVFNRKEESLRCLERLFTQALPDGVGIDVWLTNDGCTDGTPEAVHAMFQQVHIVEGDGTLFWNRGMHKAWEAAARHKDYDYYLWLNDDTMLADNAIATLVSTSMEKRDEAIIVGATVATTNPQDLTYGGRVRGHDIAVPNGNATEVEFFNGNIVLVPTAVHKTLGNLDHYFTHSKGDFDYGMRARKAGIHIFQAGKVLGTCDRHPTLDKWCDPSIAFKLRWKMLHRPNGMPPKETFHLEKRHYGIVTAIFHYITIHIRCLVPQLWIHKNTQRT